MGPFPLRQSRSRGGSAFGDARRAARDHLGRRVDFSKLRLHSQHKWPIEANWKVALENYLECYHCPVAHLKISLERWVPDGTGRTIEVTDYWFGADISPEVVAEVLEFDEQVSNEDTDLVVRVQEGLNSGTVPQGRLMRESEQLISAFQRRLYDAVT